MAETSTSELVAARVNREVRLNAANSVKEWQLAKPVLFFHDWQGHDLDPAVETEVRVLWSPATLYLRFACRYRELFVFDDSDTNGRRDHLWDRDVAEAFLQPEPSLEHYYKEFEIAPNAMWVDLDISPGGLADLKSGLIRSVHLEERRKTWVGEMAIPMRALTPKFDPSITWRANFYRVEGKAEPRQYLAWQPTRTPEPNFHVPKAFGTLRFAAR
jgi:alpha-galactosidase